MEQLGVVSGLVLEPLELFKPYHLQIALCGKLGFEFFMFFVRFLSYWLDSKKRRNLFQFFLISLGINGLFFAMRIIF